MVVITFIGCRKDSTTEPPTERDYFTDFITSDSEYGDFAAMDDDGSEDDTTSGFSKLFDGTLDSITPIRFGKKITGLISRTYDVQNLSDTVRIVSITKKLNGKLIVRGIITGTGETTRVVKPFVQTVQRKFEFHRKARTDDPRKNWRPYAVTVGAGTTPMQADSFAIDSLVITTPDTMLVITSPLETWLLFGMGKKIPMLNRNDDVNVRMVLHSWASKPEKVFLHHGKARKKENSDKKRKEIPLVSEIDHPSGGKLRAYATTYDIHHRAGRFGAIFEAMSNNSLYDNDSAKYGSSFWGVPYKVK